MQPFCASTLLWTFQDPQTPPFCNLTALCSSRTPQPHLSAVSLLSNLPGPPNPSNHCSLTFQDPPSPPVGTAQRCAPGSEEPTWRRAMAAGMGRPPTPCSPPPHGPVRAGRPPRALTEHEHGARAHHRGGDGGGRQRGAAAERSGPPRTDAALRSAAAAPRPAYRPLWPIRGRAAGRAANRKRSALSGSGEARWVAPGCTAHVRNA